jgi:hypothetical protein
MSRSKQSRLHELRALAGRPDDQARLAAELLAGKPSGEVVLAALRVLAERPIIEARPALLRLFDYYAEHGEIRDPGAYYR